MTSSNNPLSTASLAQAYANEKKIISAVRNMKLSLPRQNYYTKEGRELIELLYKVLIEDPENLVNSSEEEYVKILLLKKYPIHKPGIVDNDSTVALHEDEEYINMAITLALDQYKPNRSMIDSFDISRRRESLVLSGRINSDSIINAVLFILCVVLLLITLYYGMVFVVNSLVNLYV